MRAVTLLIVVLVTACSTSHGTVAQVSSEPTASPSSSPTAGPNNGNLILSDLPEGWADTSDFENFRSELRPCVALSAGTDAGSRIFATDEPEGSRTVMTEVTVLSSQAARTADLAHFRHGDLCVAQLASRLPEGQGITLKGPARTTALPSSAIGPDAVGWTSVVTWDYKGDTTDLETSFVLVAVGDREGLLYTVGERTPFPQAERAQYLHKFRARLAAL